MDLNSSVNLNSKPATAPTENKVDKNQAEKEQEARRSLEESKKKRDEALLNPVDKATITSQQNLGGNIGASILSSVIG